MDHEDEQESGRVEAAEGMAKQFPSLIQAVAASAVKSREQDHENLLQALAQASESLGSGRDPSELLQYAGTVLPKLECYQRKAQQYIDGLTSQLRGIIRTLISAIALMRTGADSSDLEVIEEQIMQLQTVEELAVARENLEIMLGELTKSERARKQETSGLLTRLHDRVLILEQYASTPPLAPAQPSNETAPPRQTSPETPSTSPPADTASLAASRPAAMMDRLTGIPNREAAEESILALEAKPHNRYLAALYVQNMQQLNLRFGDRICDELLLLVTQRIATNLLRPTDSMFRWRGPAFVAILEREESFSYVSHDLKRFVEHPFQFEFRSGSLLVFISIAAELVGSTSCGAAERIQELEKFFSSF
jgi:diguanylate cyclase (GGDEF)-like protein